MGTYSNDSGGGALFDLETAGRWKAINVPQSDSAYLNYVACPSATFCEAVGALISFDSNSQSGYAVSEVNGVLTAVQTPLPKGAAAGKANQVDVYSVDCIAAGACTAAGQYYASSSPAKALLLSLSGGRWVAPALPAAIAGGSGIFNAVACGPSGSCVAAGLYQTIAGLHTLLLRGSGNKWTSEALKGQTGVAGADLLAAPCFESRFCAVAGVFPDSAGNSQRGGGRSGVQCLARGANACPGRRGCPAGHIS